MGITGLLEQLKSISQNVHISQYRGKKVAIDAQCWLHRGAYSCSRELATGEETTRYISFFLAMVKMLKDNGIDSIIAVFDGIPLPCKAETNFKRSRRRTEQRQLARLAEEIGESKIAQAHYQRSVDITFAMVQRLIAALNSAGVHYMIAPYEADAQLAFLSKQKIVDLVITEDSDLLAYGCHTVLFKLDKEGNGTAIEKEHLSLSQPLSFAGWTDDQFVLFCCLAGCDYLPSLWNIGIKSAHKIVSAHKTLSRVVDHLAFSPAVLEFGGSFATRLQMAVMTFKHQTVYNPFTAQTEPLHPLPRHNGSSFTVSAQTSARLLPGGVSGAVFRAAPAMRDHGDDGDMAVEESALDFLGPQLDATVAEQLVTGLLDPRTLAASHISTSVATAAAGTCADPAMRDEVGRSVPITTSVAEDTEFPLFREDQEERTVMRDQRTRTPPRTPPRAVESSTSAKGQHRIVWTSPSDRLHCTERAFNAAAETEQVAHPGRGAKRSLGQSSRAGKTAVRGAASSTSHASATHASLQFCSALLAADLEPLHRRVKPRLAVPLLPQRSLDYTQESSTGEFCGIDDCDTKYERVAQTPLFAHRDGALDVPSLGVPVQCGDFLGSNMDDIASGMDEEAMQGDVLSSEQGLARFQDEQFLASAQNRFFLTAPSAAWPPPFHQQSCSFFKAPRTPWLWSEHGYEDRHAASAAGTGQGYSWQTNSSPTGSVWDFEVPLCARPIAQVPPNMEATRMRRCF
jgi:exonuclease-1